VSTRRPHQEEEHENEERWLITYADLITLLMVFFIVMYAMSSADSDKFKKLATSLVGAFKSPLTTTKPPINVGDIPTMPPKGEGPDASKTPPRPPQKHTEDDPPPKPPKHSQADPTEAIAKLRDQFMALVEKEGLSGLISVDVSPDGTQLFVRFSDRLLFDPGSAVATYDALGLMDKVGALILAAGKPVRVEGHTDNVPIKNAQFQSNWQLSTARAAYVIEYLISKIQMPPELLTASGYSEYHPIASNDTPDGRAQNRRVELVIVDQF